MFIKAQSCYEKGDYINSIKLYKNYLKINPNSIKANYQLAIIYQEQGKYIQAIFHYEKYIELKPDADDKGQVKTWIQKLSK